MMQRLYVHNFKCFENFELKLGDTLSALLIGKNGAGKSSIATALGIFQSIGRGVNQVALLASGKDFSCDRTTTPMRFELEVLLAGDKYTYSLGVSEKLVYARQQAQVTLPANSPHRSAAQFLVDWHLIALAVIQDKDHHLA